ncbi:MAG: 5-formyltetrahydrofolate cyclo-ligase [Rhodanobacteraceae bacterium]
MPLATPPVADPTPSTADDSVRANLRRTMRARREALSPQQRIAAAQGLRHVLDTSAAFCQARNIGGYWACAGELPLNLALASVQQRRQHYWLPRVQPGRQLEFAEWHSGDPVLANRFGIPEPAADAAALAAADMDVLLLPLLAFDATGNRLGTGGGFYDRTLAFLKSSPRPAKPLLIGIGYGFQQVEQLAAEDWDIPLDAVATETQLIECAHQRSAE